MNDERGEARREKPANDGSAAGRECSPRHALAQADDPARPDGVGRLRGSTGFFAMA